MRRINRFFVAKNCLQGELVRLGGEQTHQIRSVLRLSPGDRIIVLDNQGWEYDVVLRTVGRKEVVGQVTQKRPAPGEPRTQVSLYQSLLAREKFEWVLQKCTEVGVARFVPVVTQRSLIRKTSAIDVRRLTRWRRIVAEAAEQSGRGRIPELTTPVHFGEAVSRLGGFERCLVAWPQAQRPSLRELLGRGKPATVAILIGPEGGFTDEELQQAQAGGAMPFSLGQRILRTETAAVVAAALILYELEQKPTTSTNA